MPRFHALAGPALRASSAPAPSGNRWAKGTANAAITPMHKKIAPIHMRKKVPPMIFI
jgi:hypothetical protein